MPRVLFVHYHGCMAGSAQSLIDLAKGLSELGVAVHLVFAQDGFMVKAAQRTGLETSVLPMRGALFYGPHVPLHLRRIWYFARYYRKAVKDFQAFLKEICPDIVHLNTSVLLPCAAGAQKAGVPVVWHVREIIGKHPYSRSAIVSFIESKADVVIATSQTVRNQFSPKTKVRVVHNAVDPVRFSPERISQREARQMLDLPDDRPIVGILGGVSPFKGHFVLFEAARQVVQSCPAALFLIVAEGLPPDYATSWPGRIKRMLNKPLCGYDLLQDRIAEAGLDDNFRFARYRTDVVPLLAAMDVLTFPSTAEEGFGRPVIEAMAMERVPVASRLGATQETIVDGETGLLVPPGDPKSLSEAIVRLLTDASLRRRMAEAGRRQVEQSFTLAQHVQSVRAVYDDVLAVSVDGR